MLNIRGMSTVENLLTGVNRFGHCLTALRISGGRTRELARVDDRPLQPLDGRREAPDRQRMAIRSADGAARSVRAIALLHPRRAPGCISNSSECSLAPAVGCERQFGDYGNSRPGLRCKRQRLRRLKEMHHCHRIDVGVALHSKEVRNRSRFARE